jgi:NADH-quinone oxidoreductase subunit H
MIIVAKVLSILVPLLVGVAYFTLGERKLIASIQRRRGPNVIGYIGVLQPLADGLKLFAKESIFPSHANTLLFVLAPLWTFFLSLVVWAVVPFREGAVLCDIDLGILYLFAVSSLGVYGILTSGWASNSKYAFLGALRSAAQIVSYEVSLGFVLAALILSLGTFNLSQIVYAQQEVWLALPHLPLLGIFAVSALAETNRHPFDLPEAEAELVSGYNVEYSAIGFALFFLGEYANMLLMCALISLLFLGGWLYVGLGVKICLWVIFFIWIRAALPRYRYDQLMRLGWKVFLPLSLGWLILTFGLLLSVNGLPQ